MKQKIVLWVLSIALVASLAANFLFGRASLNYFDKSYEELAKSYLVNLELLALIENGRVEEAKQKLYEISGAQAFIIGLCLADECSIGALDVMSSSEQP